MSLIHFEIPHRSRRCCTGEEMFTPGYEYFSLLEPLEPKKSGQYIRKDFCVSCWKKYCQENLTKEGSTKEGSTKEGSTKEGSTKESSTKESSTKEGSVKEKSTKGEELIYWKSQVPLKREGPDPSLKRNERALQLLQEIHHSEESEDLVESFVLGLLLARAKVLVLKQEVAGENGVLTMLYEVAGTEEMIPIQKIELSMIQTELVQRALVEKLSVKSGDESSVKSGSESLDKNSIKSL